MRRGLVQLAAHGGDEFHRITRVLRVLAQLHPDTLKKISTAHDHKGVLCVEWHTPPEDADLLDCVIKWINEHEEHVQNVYPDGRVVDLFGGVTIDESVNAAG